MKHHFMERLSIPKRMLVALSKVANAPFEMLLECGKIHNQLAPSSARAAIHRLKQRELIYCERRDNKVLFMLTDEGEKEAEKIKSKLQSAKPKHWDGKLRIVVFDVPEKLRGKRDLLRKELVNFGFVQLQKSVWAYPYPLPQEFEDLWKRVGILKHCIIFETDNMENNNRLVRNFFSNKQVKF